MHYPLIWRAVKLDGRRVGPICLQTVTAKPSTLYTSRRTYSTLYPNLGLLFLQRAVGAGLEAWLARQLDISITTVSTARLSYIANPLKYQLLFLVTNNLEE